MRSGLEWAWVRALVADGISEREIARRLGINRRTVERPPLRRRVLLSAASTLLPRERWSVFLVSPQTLLRWHRELVSWARSG